MNTKRKELGADGLFEAILTLNTVEECYAFFEDLCTVPELRAMAQRYHVAAMLKDHRVYTVSYTHLTLPTTSRV